MKTTLMRRWLPILAIVTIAVLVLAPAVFAYLYRAPVSVIESSGNAYNMLPVTVDTDVTWLIDNGFITNSGALDTRIETYGGSTEPHMVCTDKVMTAVSVPANGQVNRYLTTDNTLLSDFHVIAGHGGYVTLSDASGLEPGEDFDIEFNGWVGSSIDLYPVVDATTTSTEVTEVTSHDVSLPSGVQVGDLLLLLFSCVDPGDLSPTITWPSGWTGLDTYEDIDSASGAAYKIVSSSEGSTVIVTTSQTGYSAHQTYRISDYTGTPETTTQATGSTSTPNSASLNPTWDLPYATLWFTFFGTATHDTGAVSSYPANYTGGQNAVVSGYAQVASARRENQVSSENPPAFALDDGIYWAAWTIGVQGATPLVEKADCFRLFVDDGDLVAELENFDYYYYRESTLEDDWVAGYSAGTGSISKQSDHLKAEAIGANSERTWVLTSTTSLANIDTLYIDWENTGSDSGWMSSNFIASTSKMGDYTTYNYRHAENGKFSRQLDSLDVSVPVGNYYIRVHAEIDNLGGAITSTLKVYNVYGFCTATRTITALNVVEGEHTVKVWNDGTDFGIDVDGSTEDSIASGRYVVRDNSNDWIIAMKYFDYYEHTVSDTLIVNYDPVTVIEGTVLPDLEGTAQNGVFTWGSNPGGIAVELGSLVSADQPTPGADPGDEVYRETLPDVGVSDWFQEPDIAGRLANNPFRPLVRIMSDGTSATEVQAWRLLGLALILFMTVIAARSVKEHLFISGVVCAGTIGVLVQQTVWPFWALVFVIPAIVAGLIAERASPV